MNFFLLSMIYFSSFINAHLLFIWYPKRQPIPCYLPSVLFFSSVLVLHNMIYIVYFSWLLSVSFTWIKTKQSQGVFVVVAICSLYYSILEQCLALNNKHSVHFCKRTKWQVALASHNGSALSTLPRTGSPVLGCASSTFGPKSP